MTCCFSGKEIPQDKLLVLYYPPAMAHQDWDKSVYASARSREALLDLVDCLKSFRRRFITGKKPILGVIAGLAGLGLLVSWGAGAIEWAELGIFQKFIQPVIALSILLFSWPRIRALRHRLELWNASGKDTIRGEIQAIEAKIANMPEDPSAEEASAVLRRKCPEVISRIAFAGSYFHAFTYMDFVMYPQLSHPSTKDDLPGQHSLYRDAYYIGDLVYDSWRLFHKDQRDFEDPRFAGSGGRRGVI